MNKKDFLDNLHYNPDKQKGNLELAYAYLDNEGNPKWSKWKKYLDVQSDEKFLTKANNRTILPCEIVLDLEEPERYDEIVNKLEKDGLKYRSFKTGSKGFHFHLFFDKDIKEKEKISFIKEYGCDVQKASGRCMIALEYVAHWKTGIFKTLIKEDEGINSFIELKRILPEEEKEELFRYECLSCGNEVSMNKIEKKKKCSCGGKLKLIKEAPKFNFSIKKPHQPIGNLGQLKEVIIRNFPSVWFETKACLSACAALSLKNLNGCPSLNLVGNPAGEKTTVLGFFYGQNKIYISDDFTPRAFVSHSANVSADELGEVDLLPKIKDNILLTPELAPLFEAPKDKLIDNFSTLTRVLDGEGLNRDSGVHGHRGYCGDYKFVWLGATTPLRSSVWTIMGKIGNRLFFLNMRDKNRTDKDYLTMFRGQAYEERVQECRGAVRSFLDNLFEKNGIRKLEWDAEGDILLLPEIIKYAKFLSKLRASLMTWKGEERGEYEYSFPIVEEPPRAINSLYNLAKGHALINGRNFLKSEDLEIVRAICFSSMPHDRHKFLQLLAKHEGKLTTQQIEKELGCSTQTATRTMKIFEVLGIVTIKNIQIDYSGTGRPMNYVEINPEFMELLTYTQDRNNGINSKFQENNSASANYDNLNPEDFVKKEEKSKDTQEGNDGKKDLFHENKPVRDESIDFSKLKLGDSNE